MDSLIIWKSLIIFLMTYLVFWVIFYTFQPGFLSNNDLAINGQRGYNGTDGYLSDAGRTKIFLWSLLPATIAVLFFLLYSYFMVKTVKIKCKKGSTNLGQCSISK